MNSQCNGHIYNIKEIMLYTFFKHYISHLSHIVSINCHASIEVCVMVCPMAEYITVLHTQEEHVINYVR